jgi:hypothetical protein
LLEHPESWAGRAVDTLWGFCAGPWCQKNLWNCLVCRKFNLPRDSSMFTRFTEFLWTLLATIVNTETCNVVNIYQLVIGWYLGHYGTSSPWNIGFPIPGIPWLNH